MKNSQYPIYFWYISAATGLRYTFEANTDVQLYELTEFAENLRESGSIYYGKDNLPKYGFINNTNQLCIRSDTITKTAIRLPNIRELSQR